jgi:hypothetical protein
MVRAGHAPKMAGVGPGERCDEKTRADNEAENYRRKFLHAQI